MSMARRHHHVVGQIAIPLPPEMLKRSPAWQRRRDQREEYRAAFLRARIPGLQARYAYKQMRLDTDEALRELGLMPPRPRRDESPRKPSEAASRTQRPTPSRPAGHSTFDRPPARPHPNRTRTTAGPQPTQLRTADLRATRSQPTPTGQPTPSSPLPADWRPHFRTADDQTTQWRTAEPQTPPLPAGRSAGAALPTTHIQAARSRKDRTTSEGNRARRE